MLLEALTVCIKNSNTLGRLEYYWKNAKKLRLYYHTLVC